MTVIQPIFYGGGSGDIKLKSLAPSIGSLTLFKNQRVSLQITPIMDLSNANLYDVSCDDSRVQLVKQPNHELLVVTPDKFDKTTRTVIHFRATDDSGVSLDVPLTLQAGLTEGEKRSWFESHQSPKQLSPSFEPLLGWKPFKDYSSGAEIIARAIRDGKRYMINAGDYFDETVSGTTYRWTISEFNHYGRNEALLVPNRLMPDKTQFSSLNNTYSDSTLESKFNSFYNAMPYSLQPYVLNMSLPWTDNKGSMSHLSEHVFPPSEIEAFGSTYYSKESSSNYKRWACFTDNSSRVRNKQWYWLRSTCRYDSTWVPAVIGDGSSIYNSCTNLYGPLPCFCIA